MYVTKRGAVTPRNGLGWLSKMCAATCLSLALVGCGGGGGDSLANQAASAVLNFLSGGAFKDLNSLVVALEGDSLVIKDFGTSDLGTNSGLLPVGSALVTGISCGPSTCTGQVLVPTISNGTLTSIGREPGTVAQSGEDSFVISAPSIGSKTFTRTTIAPSTPPTPATPSTPGTPQPVSATLNKDASCAQWWAAIGNKTLTFVATNNNYVPTGVDAAGLTLTMTGDANDPVKRYAISGRALPVPDSGNPPIDYLAGRHGELRLADKWPFANRCRFILQFDPGLVGYTYDNYILFADSLRDGRMAFSGNGENEAYNTETWVFTVN